MFPLRDLNPTRLRPLATLALIAANIAVFFLWQPHGSDIEEIRFLYENALIPCELIGGEPLTFAEVQRQVCIDASSGPIWFPDKSVEASVFVSMFLHGGLLHLGGNMWFLWIFGNNVEETYGRISYLLMYLAAGVVATLAFAAAHPDSTVALVGASGAVAGVLGAYLVLFPRATVLSLAFVFLIRVPAVLFLGLWFVAQFLTLQPGVAWEAHVAGFLAGAGLALILRRPLLRRHRALHRTSAPAIW
jgi:membrane associated rhomboid family serine protease